MWRWRTAVLRHHGQVALRQRRGSAINPSWGSFPRRFGPSTPYSSCCYPRCHKNVKSARQTTTYHLMKYANCLWLCLREHAGHVKNDPEARWDAVLHNPHNSRPQNANAAHIFILLDTSVVHQNTIHVPGRARLHLFTKPLLRKPRLWRNPQSATGAHPLCPPAEAPSRLNARHKNMPPHPSRFIRCPAINNGALAIY